MQNPMHGLAKAGLTKELTLGLEHEPGSAEYIQEPDCNGLTLLICQNQQRETIAVWLEGC